MKSKKNKSGKSPKKRVKNNFKGIAGSFFTPGSILFLFVIFISGWILGSQIPQDFSEEPPITELLYLTGEQSEYPEDSFLTEEVSSQTDIEEMERKAPMLGIVIDDCGYGTQSEELLLNMRFPLNFAILPGLKATASFSDKAHQKGFEILLHQPMESHNNSLKPGPGAIMVNMDENQINKIILKNLQEIPHACGVNNHMGSLFTENEEAMKKALITIKKKSLYFLDSRTSVNTVAEKQSKFFELKTLRRRVFLDNESDKEKIKNNIRKAIQIAKKEKTTIAIGHARYQTALALKELEEEIEQSSVRVVYLSQILDHMEEK